MEEENEAGREKRGGEQSRLKRKRQERRKKKSRKLTLIEGSGNLWSQSYVPHRREKDNVLSKMTISCNSFRSSPALTSDDNYEICVSRVRKTALKAKTLIDS